MKKIWLLIFMVFAVPVYSQVGRETGNSIKKYIAEIKPELIKIRRQIHQYPELGNMEFKTAALVAGYLKKLNIPFKEKVARTGVVGLLKGKNFSKVVAVRADMDALPIQEETDLSFRSGNEGIMHACGHDMHTAIGLGTAMVLAKIKDKLNGSVKFIFQPAEEGTAEGVEGARLMVKEGVLENPAVETIFGLHVGTGREAGYISYVSGGALASNDYLEIIIKGKGAHAASPWEGIDPVVTASQVILGLQNIRSRMTDTRIPVVVSIGIIQGGTAFNIIPEEVKLVGTIRSHDPVLREKVHLMVRKIVKGICESAGASAEIKIIPGAPVTYNNPDLTEWSVNILKKVFGEDKINTKLPSMGAEDFAHYSLKVPAFFYSLGAGGREKGYIYPGHNSKYMIDEDAIEVGVEAMVNLVICYLNSDKKFKLDF